MRLDVSERRLLPAPPQILHPRSSSARRSVASFPNPPAIHKTIAGILGEPFKISNSQATRQTPIAEFPQPALETEREA
jgi:hypothetical protein